MTGIKKMRVASGYAGVLEEDVSFPRGEYILRGILAFTESANNECAAVTLPGWAGTRAGPQRIFVSLARRLAERGIPTLRFDFAGRGSSDGDSRQANLDGMIADACAAIDFLRARGFCRISLLGICSGGNVAIGAGVFRPEAVADLVCLSTLPFSPPTTSRGRRKALGYCKQYLRKAFSPTTWKRLFHGEISAKRVTRVIEKSLREDASQRLLKDSRHEIMKRFKDFSRPVHFIYGGGDPEAPEAMQHYRQFCEANGLTGSFTKIAGANHNFYSLRWAEELREQILAAVTADLAQATPGEVNS